jgi:hypothetical protein
MSYTLSQRYSRPESSIMVNVDHSACLLLAGSFEPAYILTISALPSQLQPVTNKRNSALIQSFMAEILAVPPERGILRFHPILEENLATNGTTVFGEIERIEKSSSDHDVGGPGALKRAWTRSSRRSVHAKKPTIRNTDDVASALPMQIANTRLPTTSHSRHPSQTSAISQHSHPALAHLNSATSPVIEETFLNVDSSPAIPAAGPVVLVSTPNNSQAEKRKSNINGIPKNLISSPPRPETINTSMTAATPNSTLKPPYTPTSPSPAGFNKMSKRKSFISIFRR